MNGILEQLLEDLKDYKKPVWKDRRIEPPDPNKNKYIMCWIEPDKSNTNILGWNIAKCGCIKICTYYRGMIHTNCLWIHTTEDYDDVGIYGEAWVDMESTEIYQFDYWMEFNRPN